MKGVTMSAVATDLITNLDIIEEMVNFIKQPNNDMEAFIKEYGGSNLYIPSYKTTMRNEKIIAEYKKRMGEFQLVKKLAKENQLTERQIYDITKECRETSSLF